ncbi:MAG: HYR domain-containing protein, partial [Bacteroidota bacterium]
MKKIFTLSFLLLLLATLFMGNALAQSGNTWLQKANVGGGGRWVGVGFSIGTKGYIGTGLNAADVPIADFWEYDPAGNTWSQKANFGGGVRFGAIGFGIGAKGYVGTGSTNSGGFRDFWEYDPSANTWTRKADFGGTERYLAVGFAIGAKGYVGTGVSLGSNPDTNDFWEYNPATNTWTRKADFAGITRFAATGFGIGTKGYIGIGSNENSYERSDFWEYDPTANAWTAKAAFGGGAQTYATGFSIGSKGYIGTGEVGGAGFWEYNPATNTWTRKANYGGTNNSLWYTSGFSIGAKGYIGTGYDPNGPLRNDFWEYTPSGTAASAINFDGVNDYVAVSNPYKTFNKEITVEFWMNAASASMPFGSIMGQGVEGKDDMANNVWLMHPNNDGTMSFYVNDAGTWRFTTFSITGIVGTWHHIAGVTGPFGTKVYIDGVLVASGAGVTGTILNNASSVLHLGKDVRYASSRFANISLDEVRIWSRALCQAEIINNKNCEPNASAQTGLQEYYRFNQGLQNTDNTGVTTLSDASGNGRNGVLNNFGLTGLTSNWIASGSTNTGTCGAYAASTAPITGSLSICTGAGTTLSNANAGGIWTSSNTAVATIDAATGAVNSLSAGTSTITYKTECGGVSTATLTVNAYPVAAITGPNTVCANQPATLTASGGGTYLWSTGATTSAITIAPSSTNTYAVTVTGAGGCASSANITVNVNALPVLTVGSNSPVQTGASLNLTASGAASYSWTGPNSFTSTDQNPSVPAVTSAASGIYTVTGTSAQNCSASAALSVIVSTPAGALKFDPSLAIGDNSRLNYVGIDNPFRAYQKEITVEFWMYVPNANLPFGSVMGQSNNNDDQTLVWLMHPNSNGTMTFFVNDGGTLRGVTGNIIAGSWHHYAGVANATSTKYYIDGVLMNTGPGVSNAILSNPTSVIHIGKDVRYATRYAPNNDLTNRYATMIMDEVRVWSRALCAQEINNNKNCELFNPTGQNKLESYYNFNQGIAGGNNTAVTTLNDLSGNNRNGTLYNFTLNGANSNWVASGSTNTGTCASYVAPAAPITGSTSICMGTGTTLSNANSGGVWSSSNTNVATINASSGLVNSVGAGNTVITYKTDCGGVSTLTVTVGDNIPPVIACPSNKTLASCDAVIPNYTTSATVSDNCTAVAGIIVTQSPAAGTAIAPGANVTVTLTASDASNNTSTCSFTVTRPNLTPTANADAATVCAGSSVSVNVLANDSHPQGAALTVSDNTVPSVGTLVKNANNTFTYTAPAGYSGPVTFTYTTKANDGKIPFSGNNHYYEFVSAPGVTWTDAKGRAAAASYNGLQGYLVTVTSAAEQAFVNTKLNGAGWMGASDAAAEGIWRWVTGPEGLENGGQGRIFSNQSILGFCSANTGQGVSGNYVNWAPGEPNNCGGEHYGHFYAGTGLWNDWPDNVSASQLLGYMVEYGGLESCTPVLTATATVTITVNKAPSFTTCPSPITVNAGANCSADVSYNAVVTGTPTPTVTYIFSGATTGNGIGTGSGSTFNRGVTNITITAINSCGSTTCSFTVTVLDVTAPTISCPSNQILNLDASCNATLPDYRSLVTGVDNCTASNALVITQSPAAGTVVNSKGALIVTFTVTDASNNSSTCNISVDKQDVTAPLITCPAPIAVNNSANTCGAVVNFINPTATDNCSGAAFNFWNSGEPNDANVAHEDYLQLYNSATWNDLPNSVLNKSIVEFNSIISTTFANYSLIGTFGGHTYYISTGTATWTSSRTAAQAIGGDLASINTLAESQYLAPYGGSTWVGGYQDHSDPAYTEPGNASQNYGGWKWVDGTKLGAGQITITQIAGLPSGSTFPVGVTTNTFRATDESGNFSTCSFTVTVTDNQAPTFSSCPSNISTNATSAGGAVVTYTAPVGTDNCPGSTTTRIAGLASGSTFPIGTTTVTHRVTDASGNTANCSFTVTVVAVAPVIHCPANMTVNNAAGQCGANVNFAATETTGIPASTITYSHASGSFFPVGTTTVTATATNSVGSSNCSFNVTVVDATAPTISCPSNQTLNLDASCNATLPDYRTLLTVSDNCTAAGSLVIIQSPAAGTVVNTKGALIVTFTVKDASNNSSTCTITVDKLDVTAPVINCVAPIAVNNNTNICGAAVTYAIPTATDNCSGSAFNFFNGGEPNDANAAHEDYLQLFNSGTWNDLPNANLNRSIVEFNSVISTVFANYTLIGSFGGHTYYISTGTASWTSSRTAAQAIGGDLASINTLGESQFLAPNGGNTWVGGYHDHSDPLYVEPGNAAQNFGGWKWVDGTKLGAGQITITQIAGLPSGSTFPIGVTTNTFRATDESGNSSTCSFTVTVTDNQAPTISGCPSNISATATSAGGTVVTYTAPVGTDNCPGSTTTRIAGLASGSTFPIGTTVVTHRVTDAAGLTAQCSFTVTVAGLAPVISCPANITVDAVAGQCGATVTFAATETAAIPASTISYTENGNPVTSGSFFAVGTHTIFAAAVNAVGTSTCNFTITVVDNQFPVLTGVPSDITVECNAVPSAATITATDNCSTSVPAFTETRTEGDCPDRYTLTRTWSTTDASGNNTTATQVITVQDTQSPVLSDAPTDATVECNAVPIAAILTATDNCSTPVVTYS